MLSTVLITGDLHGNIDSHKLSNRVFPYKNLTKNDYVIITGDAGTCWYDNQKDKYIQQWLSAKPWTTLFCDGNHENFDQLNRYPVTEWHGGKVHMITDSLIHLMRGQIYEINDETYFVMGGAMSPDKHRRVKGYDWWDEELPSLAEYEEAENNLKLHNYTVDYVITHDCPSRVKHRMYVNTSRNCLNDWLNDIDAQLTFKHWYFGHYHLDETFDDRHTCLFQQVIPVGTTIPKED